jgi:uncharacterized protein (TIGR03435 family)
MGLNGGFMFERFTERARRVIVLARAEATSLGSACIDTGQLLLGLVREGRGLPARLFADAGLAREDIRDEVLRRVPAATKASTAQEIPFSAAAHRVLQHSADEAERLSHTYIGSEHLLLGLLSEDGGVAADVLTSRGLRRDWVRERLVELLSGGEPRDHPGAPSVPANTFKWPWLRFVPSRSVHILYSELKPPQQPVTNLSGPGLQAYGYTLSEAIVHAWRGNPWHIDITDGIDDGTRYDFYIQLAQNEPTGTFQQMWRDAIEQQFEVFVTRETRPREVWVARRTGHAGPMLHDCGEPEPGSGVGMASFNLAMGRPHDAPPFPLEPFTVHSVPFFYLAAWFEEFLGGPVVDQTGLRGRYGFELTRTITDREELIDLLRSQAGVSFTRAEHETPVLVVRRR